MAKRHSYDLLFKVNAVKWLQEHGNNVSNAAKEFRVNRKQIREWRDSQDFLNKQAVGKMRKSRKLHSGKKVVSVELDERLFAFFLDKRTNGLIVNIQMLQEKAKEIAQELRLSREVFRASKGYIYSWKKRYSVVKRRKTNESQKTPADMESKIREFRENIRQARVASDIDIVNIFNMDQTMCHFDMPTRYTQETKGKNFVRIKTTGTTKKGFTVALCCNAEGYKLPATVIFKERKGILTDRIFSKIVVPENVSLFASSNGWMTEEIYHDWLITEFGKDMDNMYQRRLLIVDNYRVHTTEKSQSLVEEQCNADLIFVQAGCTGLVQPLDVTVNRSFKSLMRQEWDKWMNGPHEYTTRGNMKSPTRQDIVNWVSHAWDKVSAHTIQTGFLRAGISNNLDGSQEDQLFDYVPQIPAWTEQSAELHIANLNLDPEDAENEDIFINFEPFDN